ncbi:hypothetical protein CO218_03495 [Lactiplantibacillus plantarum]|uniref:hypothetical protein n=1 Tax=Lactiplantibacillus plantarum TaxID=1590 RepID=UPI0007C6CF3E|nr:hypothetical protein [Lactiplantibacillus plantarum]AYE58285.1 hypothetical protein CO218_03495 [Lactiplantibacillus plantarum]MCW6172040.1 hypothetical protein [Lactiplantibacillus plantarum]QBJ55964.1 hypothetical protein C3O83_08215 [Lactiplantibacillus plantarum]
MPKHTKKRSTIKRKHRRMNSGMKELRRRLVKDYEGWMDLRMLATAAGVKQAINELDDLVGDGDDD